jgi:hypothetical protein
MVLVTVITVFVFVSKSVVVETLTSRPLADSQLIVAKSGE